MTRPSSAAVEVRSPEFKPARGESVGFSDWSSQLASSVAASDTLIVSLMPRGVWQAVQPAKARGDLVAGYQLTAPTADMLAWTAISRNQPVRSADIPGFDQSLYSREFLSQVGLRYAAAAPLLDPLVPGYPGAVELYRTSGQGDFTESDLKALAQSCSVLSDEISRIRGKRLAAVNGSVPRSPALAGSVFAFDASGKVLFGAATLEQLDEGLRRNLLAEARRRASFDPSRLPGSERLGISDSRGNLVPFRATAFAIYPALKAGAVLFMCAQPTCCDWATLRPQDVATDEELSRLVPAIRFMQQNYSRGPTLVEISRQVQLSPFHFHRRFTEVLGVTPKHIMLDCQIADAKRMLLAREKSLAEIARDCGFAHQSHFTSRFKQAAGLTPTRWRRAMSQPA